MIEPKVIRKVGVVDIILGDWKTGFLVTGLPDSKYIEMAQKIKEEQEKKDV